MEEPGSTSNSNLAVQADNLSKCYQIYNNPKDRLLQGLWGRDRNLRPTKYYRDFWALQNISFKLQKGQTLGIVGKNGCGKSTLLQLVCGTLQPTHGRIIVNGRIGALLELGSGFNPEFSGLENIYLNAAILGLKKREVDDKLDKILAFADIGEFINQAVKTYSSGMAVRLAFAVQAHIDPEVLIIDEALAVGDELFQKKCYDHLARLKDSGTAILLVTHSCPQIIQHCDRALLLHKGRARMLGEPARVTVTYQRLLNASDSEWDKTFQEKDISLGADRLSTPELSDETLNDKATGNSSGSHFEESAVDTSEGWFDKNLTPETTEVYPSRGARIEEVWIESTTGNAVNTLSFGIQFTVVFKYKADKDMENVGLACHIANHTGLRITGQTFPACLSPAKGGNIALIKAGSSWEVRYCFHGGLWPGTYFIGGGIMSYSGESADFIHRVIDYKAIRILEANEITVVGASSLRSVDPVITGIEHT